MRGFSLLVLVALLSFITDISAAQAQTAKYYVPPALAEATIQIIAKDAKQNRLGVFQETTGLFHYDASTKTVSGLKLAIDCASLLSPKGSDTMALYAIMEPSRFPEITFIQTDGKPFDKDKTSLNGVLSMKGEHHEIAVEAALAAQQEKGKLGIMLIATLPASALKAYGEEAPAADSEVKLSLTITGLRQRR